MAQLSLKITAETDDPVWQWGRSLVSAIERRARAEGVEIVFTFQAQDQGQVEATLEDETSGVSWIVPGFRHRCRCGRHVRFRCRADCSGPNVPVGVFVQEPANLGIVTSDGWPRGQDVAKQTRKLSRQRMLQIIEQHERGLSYGEIANKMGVSPERVRQLHQRALELRSKGVL
jgi:hypothetical protein